MKSRDIGTLTVVGLILAAVGIVAPIIWDRYKSTTALEVQLISNSRIVGGGPTVDKLQFSYDGRPVAKLSKLVFVLANTGRTAVRLADIVAPPKVTFSGTQVLDARIDGVSPANLVVTPELDSSNHSVALKFQLLNPGDHVQFSVLTESDDAPIEATARIAGLTALAYVDKRGETPSARQRIPWTVWVVGVFTVFCLFGVVIGVSSAGEEAALQRLFSSDLVVLPTGLTPDQYLVTLRQAVTDTGQEGFKKITGYLAALPASNALDEGQVINLRSVLREAFSPGSMVGMAIFFVVLSTIGVVYIYRATS